MVTWAKEVPLLDVTPRVTEDGAFRLTEDGELRILEARVPPWDPDVPGDVGWVTEPVGGATWTSEPVEDEDWAKATPPPATWS